MCGRITILTGANAFISEFGLNPQTEFNHFLLEPRYNVPPTLDIPVIRQFDDGRQLSMMRWGLIPPWTKDPKKAPLLNNARAETVTEKPSFRSAFKSRRCIIPVSGFYEWKTEGKEKQPFYFRHPDGRPLAFAGLWEKWNEIETCTIITTDANEVMTPIHHRMPVVLGRNDYEPWLDPAAGNLTELLTPCPADELTCYPVDRFVNNVRNQGPKCIEPIDSQQANLFPIVSDQFNTPYPCYFLYDENGGLVCSDVDGHHCVCLFTSRESIQLFIQEMQRPLQGPDPAGLTGTVTECHDRDELIAILKSGEAELAKSGIHHISINSQLGQETMYTTIRDFIEKPPHK